VAWSSVAYGSAGAGTDVGSTAVSRSCTRVPACARNPTMIAGARVVPSARVSDRVASAEFDSLLRVLANIM